MEIVSSFIGWLKEMGEECKPVKKIEWYERGAFLRPWKEPKLMTPGLYFKIPFYDTVYECIVTPDTLLTKPVYVTTLDGYTIMVEPIFCIEIVDAIKHIIYTNEGRSNFHDTGMGVVLDAFSSINWKECYEADMKETIKDLANEKAGDMGVRVNNVYFKSIALVRLVITQV